MQVLLAMHSLKFQPYLQGVPRQSATSDPVIRRVSLRLPEASRTTHEPDTEKNVFQYADNQEIFSFIHSFINRERYPDLGHTGTGAYPRNTGLKEGKHPGWNASRSQGPCTHTYTL